MGTLELKIPRTLWPFKPTALRKALSYTKHKKFNYPQCWDDLTRSQFMLIQLILHLIRSKPIQRALNTIILCKINIGLWSQMHLIQRIQLQWLFDWIYSENSVITKNFFPVISAGFAKFHGPSDTMGNINAAEFSEADYHFLNYTKSGKSEDLDKLIATLYRKEAENINTNSADFNGNLREAFNSYTVDKRAKKLAKISVWKKMAILTFYRGCRKEIELTYDRVFTQKTQKSAENYGWPETFLGIVEGKITELDKLMSETMHNIFLKMQIDLKNKAEWERKNKKK